MTDEDGVYTSSGINMLLLVRLRVPMRVLDGDGMAANGDGRRWAAVLVVCVVVVRLPVVDHLVAAAAGAGACTADHLLCLRCLPACLPICAPVRPRPDAQSVSEDVRLLADRYGWGFLGAFHSSRNETNTRTPSHTSSPPSPPFLPPRTTFPPPPPLLPLLFSFALVSDVRR